MRKLIIISSLAMLCAAPASAEYLGRLSSNPYAADSTSNPYGRYGSPYSNQSVNNPYATQAPKIYGNGSIYGD